MRESRRPDDARRVVVGVERAERRLTKAGITDFAVLEGCDLDGAVFDEATHTWTLPTCRARIVITDQIRSGRDDLVPYLGVAVHGVPNYFMVTGTARCAARRRRAAGLHRGVPEADAAHRQHAHRGSVQHPAHVPRPQPRQTRPRGRGRTGAGCESWRRRHST